MKPWQENLTRCRRTASDVVVLPGNHDINNPSASSYEGSARRPTEQVTPGEFAEIYEEFGYGQAWSRDPYSLRYTYDLDPSTRLMSAGQAANMTGAIRWAEWIKTETYEWIEEHAI